MKKNTTFSRTVWIGALLVVITLSAAVTIEVAGLHFFGSRLAQAFETNETCQAEGFDSGVATWQWNNGDPGQYFPESGTNGTSVSGTSALAAWTADPAVDGVIRQSGSSTDVFLGGSQGVIQQGVQPIDSIVFCNNDA